MFDIGWTEILILAVISLFVIGPKDIPKFLGFIGKMIGKIRGITSDFRETVDDAIKNSELEDVRKEISFTDPQLSKNINEILNPNTTSTRKQSDQKEKRDNKGLDKKINIKNESNQNDQKQEFAGPTEKLPTGLKHIREDDKKEDKIKSDEA